MVTRPAEDLAPDDMSAGPLKVTRHGTCFGRLHLPHSLLPENGISCTLPG